MLKNCINLVCVLLLPACLLVSDSAAKVTGLVIDENNLAYSHCTIDLLVIEDDQIQQLKYASRQIDFTDAGFEQVFIIQPERLKYIVEIGCDESSDIYRSKPVAMGSSDGLSHPVKLGTIVLKRK